jgi:predicted RNase H-like HicB family nuclease
MITYAVNVARRYDGMFVATFPDVPEAIALGRDDEEAFEEAKRVLEAALQRCLDEDRALPSPRTRSALGVTTEKYGEPALA